MENKIINCEICGCKMKTRVNGSHLMRKHNITLEQYKTRFPNAEIGKRTPKQTSYVCKIDNVECKNLSSLSRRLKLFHNMSLDEYYVKYYLNGIQTLCKCGCGQKTNFNNMDVGFNDYLIHHGPHISQESFNILYRKLKKENKCTKRNISFEILNKEDVGIVCLTSPYNYTKILKNLYPNTYKFIDENYEITNDRKKRFSEKVYKYVYGENKNKCIICGNSTSFDCFTLGYKKHCSQSCQQISTSSKYGVKNLFQSEIIKNKMKETWLKKYGVENPYFSNKCKWKFKDFKMPSGKIVKVQGYEHFALTFLLSSYDENKIETEKSKIPKIKYAENGKERTHCPDLYIKSENTLIEVKSNFTFKMHKENVFCKKENSINQGYKYRILIFNDDGTLNREL